MNADFSIDNLVNFEKREGTDRRSRNRPFYNKYDFNGRRSTSRREKDELSAFKPDRHSSKTFAVILCIVMLSVLDSILTLFLIDSGAAELNPVMNYYLSYGPLVFFGIKYLMTIASILIILLYGHRSIFNFRKRVNILYIIMIIPMALVVNWEFYLIFFYN